MNVERFQKISRGISILLKVMGFLLVVIGLVLVAGLFYKENNFEFTYQPPNLGFFSQAMSEAGGIEGMQEAEKMASMVVLPLTALVQVYILFQGSRLFQYLADGYGPFRAQFAQDIKHLSFLMMISDVVFPILYSIVVNIFYPGGHHLSIGITFYFFLGLILYLVAEIFNYGIELQHLADETV